MNVSALIAEDEPLLAAALKMELQGVWPELAIVETVRNGQQALDAALLHKPDVLFLDIQMPGMTGLECAQALAEDWPPDGKPFPLVIFVTAYDQFAVQAFERSAFDYLLKPVQQSRLEKTCERIKQTLASRAALVDASAGSAIGTSVGTSTGPSVTPSSLAESALSAAVHQMRELLSLNDAGAGALRSTLPQLQVIQASTGNTISMVPIGDVLYFESADKYVRVVTAEREYLIRTPLRELVQQLDTERFWQVHRSVIVRCDAIAQARRDEFGKLTLTLRGSPDQIGVSRLYAERFKAM